MLRLIPFVLVLNGSLDSTVLVNTRLVAQLREPKLQVHESATTAQNITLFHKHDSEKAAIMNAVRHAKYPLVRMCGWGGHGQPVCFENGARISLDGHNCLVFHRHLLITGTESCDQSKEIRPSNCENQAGFLVDGKQMFTCVCSINEAKRVNNLVRLKIGLIVHAPS